MVEFCQKHNVPHEICGKLVVATDSEELSRMETLMERGIANGLEGIRKLSGDELREIEPNCGGIGALQVPQEGIVDYPAVVQAMASDIEQRGGRIVTNAHVADLIQRDQWVATTSAGDFTGDLLINCAGLHCDRVSQLAGHKRSVRIVPFRGEYYQLKPSSRHLVRHLIYPVPDPKFPFLGVHFTRMIHGGIEAGPNAVLAFAREGYTNTQVNLRDLADAPIFQGCGSFCGNIQGWRLRNCGGLSVRNIFVTCCKSLSLKLPSTT